jgi:hypothetical protein
MAPHERGTDTGQSRLKRLYDRLAALLHRIPPERRTAFTEYLDVQTDPTTSDDGRAAQEDDRESRQGR